MKPFKNRIISTLIAFALVLSCMGVNANADIVIDDISLVISQVYVSNNGTYNQRFIELYNNSPNDIDMSGCTVQYGTATATSFTQMLAFTDGTLINSKGFFLIACGTVSATGLPLDPDYTWNQALATNAKIAICAHLGRPKGTRNMEFTLMP